MKLDVELENVVVLSSDSVSSRPWLLCHTQEVIRRAVSFRKEQTWGFVGSVLLVMIANR